jgi:hypothetical protein
LKFNTAIEHKVRNSIILTFTSFSITQLEKLAFYVHGLSSYTRIRHRHKAYWPYIPKMQFSDRRKFKFFLQEPWNSIEHKVRNSIILTFTTFSITQLKELAFYVHRLSSYARTRQQQKAYWTSIPKTQFSDRRKFKFLLQGALYFNRT